MDMLNKQEFAENVCLMTKMNLNEGENSHEDIMFILHKNQYYKDCHGAFSEIIGG